MAGLQGLARLFDIVVSGLRLMADARGIFLGSAEGWPIQTLAHF